MPQWYRIYCASITHARYKKPPNYSCLWVVLTKACRNGHTPPSGNMTVSWWPHDRFISQHSTLLFLILAGLLRNGLAHLHGCSEATMRTLQQKSGATQFYGGTAGVLTGAWGVRQEPRWSSPNTEWSPQWTPCTNEIKEEPHGGRTPGAGFTSLFRDLQTLCCGKLTGSYGGSLGKYVHVKHTPLLIANWSTKTRRAHVFVQLAAALHSFLYLIVYCIGYNRIAWAQKQ